MKGKNWKGHEIENFIKIWKEKEDKEGKNDT